MGTKLFTVHYREEASGSLTGQGEDAILVKQGFSWPAFLFGPFWLLFKRMWIVFVLFLALAAGLTALGLAGWVPDDAVTVLGFGLHLLLGFEGNDLYRWTLARRRCRERAAVAAENRLAAERRYFTLAEGRFP
ncbi:MAG: DUF2628 domain-containing protein [Parvibaculaceae bacterium]